MKAFNTEGFFSFVIIWVGGQLESKLGYTGNEQQDFPAIKADLNH